VVWQGRAGDRSPYADLGQLFGAPSGCLTVRTI
jgi:hypothetical protein